MMLYSDGDDSPDISAVVVSYNSARCIAQCLGSLYERIPALEVIVVDNASSDGTVGLVQQHFPASKLIALRANSGFGRASNRGAKEASGDVLLFVNPDVVVEEVDQQALSQLLHTRPLGICVPRLADRRSRGVPSHYLFRDRHWLGGLARHVLGPLRPREWVGRFPAVEASKADWATGAMLLVRRNEFLELGGFDPRYFLFYEDRDLCRRYRAAGLPFRPTEAVTGSHTWGGSTPLVGLGCDRAAWGFLAWIQYVHTHRGPKAARRAAILASIVLRIVSDSLRLIARIAPGSERISRKARQLPGLRAFLRSWLDGAQEAQLDEAGFYGDAREALGHARHCI